MRPNVISINYLNLGKFSEYILLSTFRRDSTLCLSRESYTLPSHGKRTSPLVAMTQPNTSLRTRWLLFSLWIVLSVIFFLAPALALVNLSFSQDDASYLVTIPFISAAVLYMERKRIFSNVSTDKALGGALLLLAGIVALVLYYSKGHLSSGLQFSGWILAIVLLWVSGFALFFGKAALNADRFPFLFLLLTVPIPSFLLERIILLLQEGSAWITGVLFDLAGVPVLREGLVFHLAQVDIEVAKECSGIRSSMALLILALLIAHFRLRSSWSKILFVVFGVFMMIVKNGVRIATLTLLAIYVDPGFLSGRLHHQGGVVFFVLALLLLLPLLFFLERVESKSGVVPEPS